jgi:hypothetical protein
LQATAIQRDRAAAQSAGREADQSAGRRDGAAIIGVGAGQGQHAGTALGETARAGQRVVAGQGLRAAGNIERRRASAVQEHRRALRLAGRRATLSRCRAAGHAVGAGETAAVDRQVAAVSHEDGAAQRRPAAAIGAETRTALAGQASTRAGGEAAPAAGPKAAPTAGLA